MVGLVFAVIIVISSHWTTIALTAGMVIAVPVVLIIVAVVTIVLMKR